MADMADWINDQYNEHDEFYEDRLIVEDYGNGMSISAISAKYELPISDVIDVLEWANVLKKRGNNVL